MSKLKKRYLRALTDYFQGADRTDSFHPTAAVREMLQGVEPEEIVLLHEQCMNMLAANVEPEEALKYYRLSYVYLMELLAHYRYQFRSDHGSEEMMEELRILLFKTHHFFQTAASKYENVLQHMDCGIVLFDHEGYVSFVNVLMARFLKMPRKSLLGLNLRELATHPMLPRSFRRLVIKLHREMFVYRLRYHEVIDDCGRHYLITATYGEELDGDLLISVKDVTEFKKIEQSAYQNDKLAMLGKIAAAIAHEIRNPLTSIRGFIQLLMPHLAKLGKEEYARIIIEEIDRTNDIIHEFLNSAKPSVPVKRKAAVADLLKEITLLFQSEAIMQSCDIYLDPIDPDLTVCIDVKQLKQALLNIVRNALDAINGRESPCERGMIRLSAARENGKAVISVRDNGVGMDYHTQAKLFDPFFTTKMEGTGLGLAMTYRIVKNHDGHIKVTSEPGKGTVFYISIPLC
jgi:signal transduction histidine kinase